MSAARPVDELLSDPQTAPQLKTRLRLVESMLEFAGTELALDNDGSYTAYADIGRPYVVWNVVATPPLSLDPERWCFLFAGCVPYRGYFNQQDAIDFSRTLEQKGLDVAVSGVPAYSTLGWFDDPLLNTFLFEDELNLADLIFHELAHQRLYLKDDSDFNEAFAVVAADHGVQLWAAARDDNTLLQVRQKRKLRESSFFDQFERTRARLETLYAGPLPDAQKLASKKQVLEDFKAQYRALLADWGVAEGGVWLERDLNNARFASATTYRKLVPAFEALWRQNGEDPGGFYLAAEKLSHLPLAERQAAMAELAAD